MEKDLKYIDDIVKKQMQGYSVQPSLDWNQFSKKMSSQSTVHTSKGFLSTITAKIIIAGFVVGSVVASFFLFNNSAKQEKINDNSGINEINLLEQKSNDKVIPDYSDKTNVDSVRKVDTTMTEIPVKKENQDFAVVKKKKTETVHKTVVVKRQVVVKDTIRK